MGFAASQARLLLLTARKSDLEFRAQQITNAEMMLAMQTEEVAREYSAKLSNQTLKYIDQGDNSQMKELSASKLTAVSGLILQEYGGKDANGNPIWNDWKNNGVPTQTTTYTGTDNEGKAQNYSEEQYQQALKDGLIKAENFKPETTNSYSGTTNDYTAPQLLQGIQNGSLRIMDATGTEEIDVFNGTAFAVTYNTADDAAADAEYRTKTAALQVKEKRLQMDLQQVEAQQKACESEMDSVKKVMDKNIEKTFKVFS